MKTMIDFIYKPFDATWSDAAKTALASLFDDGRYGKRAASKVQVRVNGADKPGNVPFAALIPPGQPDQGAYGGMSFVVFPTREEGPSLIGLVVGTNGIQPDEEILSRPGHARKTAAISRWLNHMAGRRASWAKHDPVRTDIKLPQAVYKEFVGKEGRLIATFEKYGSVFYAMYAPPPLKEKGRNEVDSALRALLDVMFEERGQDPMAPYKKSVEIDRAAWLQFALADLDEKQLSHLLDTRRYVVLEGPPGTGKTYLALKLLSKRYGKEHSMKIQFHPSTTYESFVGGLMPESDPGESGLKFSPRMGPLMEAAQRAIEKPDQPFLLFIDEINRADLSKVLGEAIFLFEPDEERPPIELQYDFGPPFHRELHIPRNLHILGTMNSADRSIAILDLAIRRRFAFVQLWPQAHVVVELAGGICQKAYNLLLSIFLEHASDETFDLMPGHGYFLATNDKAKAKLSTGVAPLLREYLKQGYVAGFSDDIHAYIDWLETL